MYLFPPARLINSIKHEHSCKVSLFKSHSDFDISSGVFLLVGYLISVLIVLMVVLNLKLHHLGETDKEVPDWLQRFTQKVLARITCWRGNKVDTSEDEATDKTGKGVNMDKDRIQKNDDGRQSSLAWEQANAAYSYQDIAMMLDKVCFIVFSFLTLVTTVVFLLVLITSS